MVTIVTTPKSQEQFRHPIQLQAVADQLPDDEIDDICRGLGHKWGKKRGQEEKGSGTFFGAPSPVTCGRTSSCTPSTYVVIAIY